MFVARLLRCPRSRRYQQCWFLTMRNFASLARASEEALCLPQAVSRTATNKKSRNPIFSHYIFPHEPIRWCGMGGSLCPPTISDVWIPDAFRHDSICFSGRKKPLFVREWPHEGSVQLELFEKCPNLLTVELESGLPLGNLQQFNQRASDERFARFFRMLRQRLFDEFW